MGFAALYPSQRFPAMVLADSVWLAGCDEQVNGYLPVSAIARNGFVTDRQAAEARGRQIRRWGLVDYGNLYGDGGARLIFQEWWSGEGPRADTWRFNLKAGAGNSVGRSFQVHVPNDAGRGDLLRRFVADARVRTPTKFSLRGRLFTFDSPTQVSDLTGLYPELESSQDIRLTTLGGG